jgi:hypothetical protein
LTGAVGPSLIASDIIRSMTRAGFSRDEIYDVLSGIGLPGEQVQLLIDRVAAEFHDAGLEPRPSRLSAEVEIVFEKALGKLQHTMLARMDTLTQRLELAKTELEKLGRRVVELQSIMIQTRRPRSRSKHLTTKSARKSGKL